MLGATASAGPAMAQQIQARALAGVAQPIGGPQGSEYGAGGGGALAVAVQVHPVVAPQIAVGGFGVSKGDRPADPSLAERGAGGGVVGTAGVRISPFGATRPAGLWLDVGGGFARTGSLDRPAVETHVGYDFRLSRDSRWDLGPFVGFTQIVQPDDALRPEDARIGWLGLAFGWGRADPAGPAPRPVERDQVVAAEPAREEPPPPPEVVAIADRDGDGVPDAEDACPDVPGVASSDPSATGCPTPVEGVRVEGDRIVLDDLIHFDNDSPRVRHVSWAIVRRVADLMSSNPDILEIDIEGHADFVGTTEHNQRLSFERAEAVRRLLVQFGVDGKRITTRGYGKQRPRVQGFGEEQRRVNRRVEFTITKSRPARVGAR